MMKQGFRLTALCLLILLLAGCNLPSTTSPNETSSDDSMATEIAKILTGTPIQVLISPTASFEMPEVTPSPSATIEALTATPTQTFTFVPADETPTPTTTSTLEPSPTLTLADTDPALTLGTPDWTDTMEDGDNWPTGINDYTSIAFGDGFMKLTSLKDVDGWRHTWAVIDNFYLEATLKSPQCEGSDHYGLMFRVPEDSSANKGYLFGITCDGQYSLRRWDSQTMYYLVNWTSTAAINQGSNAVNKIGVWANGANIGLYINGQKIKEVSNDAYLDGKFGFFVGWDVTEDLTVWVDQARYWLNP
jgi:hypothetical protein